MKLSLVLVFRALFYENQFGCLNPTALAATFDPGASSARGLSIGFSISSLSRDCQTKQHFSHLGRNFWRRVCLDRGFCGW